VNSEHDLIYALVAAKKCVISVGHFLHTSHLQQVCSGLNGGIKTRLCQPHFHWT